MCKKQGLFLILLFFLLPAASFSEMQLSFFVGPSFPFQQDIKTKIYDANQNVVAQNFLEADSYAGIEAGTKFTYFFHRNFGVENQISYSRIRTDLKGADSKFNNATMKQERYAFLLSGIFRMNLSSDSSPSPLRGEWRDGEGAPRHERPREGERGRFRISSLYLGLGLGAIYSDFDFIDREWGFGGKLFLGADFPLTEKFALFFESQYLWAPDAGGGNQSQGENLKTSGSPNNNFSNKLFGPHNDTQFLSLLLGTKFKIK